MSEENAVVEAPKSDVVSVNSENLDDFNAQALGLPAEAAEPIEIAEPEVAEEQEPEEIEAEKKPKKKNSFQERISELNTERKAAQEEAARERVEKEQLRKELDALKKQSEPEPVVPEPDGKPKQDDYKEWADYVEALSDWKVDQKFRAREIQQAEESAKQAWRRKVEETRAEFPDYDEVMASGGDIVLPNAVLAAIQESDIGPKLAHHLAANPDVAEALSKLSITSQVKQIGKIEASLSKAATPVAEKPAVQISKAPQPVTPIKGMTTFENKVDVDGNFHGTPDEFKALYLAGKIK